MAPTKVVTEAPAGSQELSSPSYVRAISSYEESSGTSHQTRRSSSVIMRQLPSFLVVNNVSTAFDITMDDLKMDTPSKAHRVWLAVVAVAAMLDFLASLIWKNGQPEFGIIFSVLWFIDAFVKAQSRRDQNLRDYDKRQCFEETSEDDSCNHRKHSGAWRAYYATVLMQLLLLPVGFFLFFQRLLLDHGKSLTSFDSSIEISLPKLPGLKRRETETFLLKTNHCLLIALLEYMSAATTHLAGLRLNIVLKNLAIRMTRRLAVFAVRRPFRFTGRLRRVLAFVRWAKYLGPVLGSTNRLRETGLDMLKKWRQHLEAKRSRRPRRRKLRRRRTLYAKSPSIVATGKIRSNPRSRRASQTATARWSQVETRRSSQPNFAAMQTCRKVSFAEESSVLFMRKKQELAGLQTSHKMEKDKMCIEDRRRMYELQEELGLEADKFLNRRLLLRPNTSFAVNWKIVTVICLLIEVIVLAAVPSLAKLIDAKRRQTMDAEEILVETLVPKSVADWEECKPYLSETGIAQAAGRIIFDEKRPWYCETYVANLHDVLVWMIETAVANTLVLVGIVCFLDVFITFFTGELDNSDDGGLIPKPFFQRWILPGVLTQLLVNPQMESTSKFAVRSIRTLLRFGPIRCWRWTAALFYPLFRIVLYLVGKGWIIWVRQQNLEVSRSRDEKGRW